ncbi:MAG: peptidoglycan bridge formation glycyltransferase FemA/FemB family protein [Anaerolineae bacterium]|nr:peptidoglycan bridge formation glycyltransferase FemA/FemB family protein [Anaerolineae bacterium]
MSKVTDDIRHSTFDLLMPIVSLSDWNQFLSQHPNAHLLQTGEWGELKSAFGWKSVRIITGDIGVQILFRKLPLGFTVGYIPKPAISNQSINNQVWSEIDDICRKHRAIFCRLEPDSWETNFIFHLSSFIPSKHNIQPPRTIIVDIKDSEEQILARMKQKTRYNIRLAEKKDVTVRAWDDIESFHKMMLLTGGRDKFGVHSLEYYRRAYELFYLKQMCEILVAEYQERPLAALFVARNGNRAYYLYGASTDEERNRMPTYLLQWEAMKWARERGCEEYDLWGVPDEDETTLEANFETRHDGLWGVYRFKRGFGGELKRSVQAMDRVYNPLLYWAYLRFVGNRE